MSVVLDILSWVLLVSGGSLCIAAGIGVLRLPDVYSRLHASGMADTGGTLLVLLGLALQSDSLLEVTRLAVLYAILMLTAATATHALARSVRSAGLPPAGVEPEENDDPPNVQQAAADAQGGDPSKA